MHIPRALPPLAAIFACAAISLSSSAAISYRWVTDAPTYTVPVNSTVPVSVFLEETVTDATPSALLTEDGLFSAGIRIVLDGAPPSDPAEVLSRGDITFNPAFTGGALNTDPPDRLLVIDGLLAPPGPVGIQTSPGVRRVLIGTFNFTGGALVDQTTNLRVVDYDLGGPSQDTLTTTSPIPPHLRALDNLIAPATFSITTVVPEPSALAGTGLFIAFALRRRLRQP